MFTVVLTWMEFKLIFNAYIIFFCGLFNDRKIMCACRALQPARGSVLPPKDLEIGIAFWKTSPIRWLDHFIFFLILSLCLCIDGSDFMWSHLKFERIRISWHRSALSLAPLSAICCVISLHSWPLRLSAELMSLTFHLKVNLLNNVWPLFLLRPTECPTGFITMRLRHRTGSFRSGFTRTCHSSFVRIGECVYFYYTSF